MKIEYITRRGSKITKLYTQQEAVNRLYFLDNLENDTKNYAPTDTSDTRFSYCAEANAIRRTI